MSKKKSGHLEVDKERWQWAAKFVGPLDAPKVRVLTANEKKALEIMERHLSGYTGILSHSTWKGLRDDIVYLVEKRKVRKVKEMTLS